MVCDHIDSQADDSAVARGRDFTVHVVVAREASGHQVLRPVFHPFHGLARDDRTDDRAHVARVDAYLVSETAADIWADDLNLVFREAGHQRIQRPVRVRCLSCAPDRELAGHPIHVRDRATRLHRRWVHARIQHVLRDDYLGVGEDGIGGVAIARLPVKNVIVGLAFDVVSNDGGTRFERGSRVHHRGQFFVFDVDEF